MVDGKPGPEYDGIVVPDLPFGRDGKHTVYVARRGSILGAHKEFLVLDGQTGPEYDQIDIQIQDLVFSPDGNRVAYKAYKGDILSDDARKEIIVVDGKSGAEYDRVGKPVFSPDGKRVAYTAQRRGDYIVVVDGQPDPSFDDLNAPGNPVFSQDGRHIAYRTRKHIVVDGHSGPEYQQIIENGPTFGTDGLLEYLAVKEGALFRVRQIVAP